MDDASRRDVESEVGRGLAGVRARIEAACARSGRSPAEVRLVGVAKLQPDEAIRAAVRHGLSDLGESYAQDLRSRVLALADLPGIRWHAVGTLQRNKAKIVAAHAQVFHALDRVDIARALSDRRPDDAPPLECYVEVNVGGERTKAGVGPDEVGDLVTALAGMPGLDVVGLMGMPPPASDPEQNRPHFRALRTVAEAAGLRGLSMGTTDDFDVAVEEGATVLRVGRAIFGARPARHG